MTIGIIVGEWPTSSYLFPEKQTTGSVRHDEMPPFGMLFSMTWEHFFVCLPTGVIVIASAFGGEVLLWTRSHQLRCQLIALKR